jgi:hypothetical protein
MIAGVQRNPYKMGKLRAVLENHPNLLGFANAGNSFSCSLGFLVYRLIRRNRIRVLHLK